MLRRRRLPAWRERRDLAGPARVPLAPAAPLPPGARLRGQAAGLFQSVPGGGGDASSVSGEAGALHAASRTALPVLFELGLPKRVGSKRCTCNVYYFKLRAAFVN